MDQPTPRAIEEAPTPLRAVKELLGRGEAELAASTVAALRQADGATLLTQLGGEERQELVRHLSPGAVAKVLEELETEDAVSLVETLEETEETAPAAVLDLASPDVACDVLRAMPPERAEAVLAEMATAEAVTSLLQYSDESAGGLMVPDFVVLREGMTAEEAIGFLRGTQPKSITSNYLFVLDVRNALSGVVGLRDLVLAPAQAVVRELMDPEVITVPAGTDQEECARIMQRYDLVQLPVVDAEGQVLGAILAEDIIDVIEQEATEDMLQLAGVTGSKRILNPFRRAFRDRLPWLVLNLATVLLAASVINIFESTIAGAVFLVVFLPMVASQGGVAGSQTLTLVTRGLALGQLTFANARRVIVKEATLGIATGVVTGLMAGALAYGWKGSGTLGLVVGVAMVLNLAVAGLSGALVPLALKALRLDPALGSVVVVTTITDMAGFGFVLGLAAWWLI